MFKLINGDALSAMSGMASGSVNCIVTSPPYWGLRDYDHAGQVGLNQTLPEYIRSLVEIFREARRVLSDDGTLWVNVGDGHTSGNRASRPPDTMNPNRALALRPRTPEGLKPKDLLGVPWRLAFALQDDGWYLRSEIVWNKPNAMPESVKDRPTRSHEYIFMLTKSKKYYYNRDAAHEEVNGVVRNRRSVWNVNTKGFSGAHFATYPVELVKPCIELSTREGDVVMDMFSGAATTGICAHAMGRSYIGVELNPGYIDISVKRASDAGISVSVITSGSTEDPTPA